VCGAECTLTNLAAAITALLFSATFKKTVENVARDILTDPVRIAVGVAGESNADVTQIIEVLSDESQKLSWTLSNLPRFVEKGNVIIFAGTKNACVELTDTLLRNGIKGTRRYCRTHDASHDSSMHT